MAGIGSGCKGGEGRGSEGAAPAGIPCPYGGPGIVRTEPEGLGRRKDPDLSRSLTPGGIRRNHAAVRWMQWTRAGVLCGVLAAAGCSPRGPEALRQGDELMVAGRAAEAIPYLERAVADLPGEATAWNQLGLAYHAVGRRGEAQKAYLRALNDDRNFFDAHYNLGTLEFEEGHWREAERSLRTYLGVEANRTNVVAWRMLGDALLSSGQTEAAERALATALQLAPNQSPVINSLGMALASRRRYKEAQARFQQAVRVNPQDPASALNLAIVTQQLGDRRSALEQYRRYLSLAPEGSGAAGVRDLVAQLEAQLSPPPALATNRVPLTNAVAAPAPVASGKASTNALASGHPNATNVSAAARSATPGGIPLATGPQGAGVTAPSNSAAKPTPAVGTAAASSNAIPRVSSAAAPTNPPPPRVPEPQVPLEIVRVQEAPALRPARDPVPASSNRTLPPTATTPSVLGTAADTSAVGEPPPPERATQAAASPPPSATAGPAAAPKPALTQERKTFWQRVSPANWGNPTKWFGDDEGQNRTNAPAGQESPRQFTRVTENATPGSTNRSAVSSTQVSPAPAPSKPVIPRYARRAALSVAPGDRAAAEALARQAESTLDRDAALRVWQRVVQSDPSWTSAWMQTGRLALEASNTDLALQAGEAVTTLDPSSAGAHQLFAASLARTGYPKDAADHLEKAASLAPGNAALHLALAGIYARDLGEPNLARPHYEQVLALDPRNPQAGAIRVWLANNP